MKLDEVDLKILRLIQNDAKLSVKAIAKKVFFSAPTVASRIAAMTESGIIKGYYTDIDLSAVEDNIKAYVDMEVAPSAKEELYEFLRARSQVLECSHVTGEYSLLIKCVFKNTMDMDKFITELQVYGRTKTQIVFSTIIDRKGITL